METIRHTSPTCRHRCKRLQTLNMISEKHPDGLTCPSANSFSSLSCSRAAEANRQVRINGRRQENVCVGCSNNPSPPHLRVELPCLLPLRSLFPWAFALNCERDSAAELCLSPAPPRPSAASWPRRFLLAAPRSAVTQQTHQSLITLIIRRVCEK